jgi:hypothetical protein
MTARNRPSVLVRMGRLRPGTVLPASYPDGSSEAPFDGSPGALAVKGGRGRAGLPACLVPNRDRKDVMDAAERAVPVPQVEVLPDRAARRQVLRQRLPRAPRPQPVEDGVEYLADVHRARPPAALGRTDQRRHQRPFGIGQIARVAQAASIRGRSMVRLPQQAPLPDSGAAHGITTGSRDATSSRMRSKAFRRASRGLFA